MQCPFCQHPSNRVLESRAAEAGRSIRRRRECLKCNCRFTTYERIEYVPITVVKRNGDRELFNRSKLLRGIIRACEKTGLEAARLDTVIDNIEADLQQRSAREIVSADIGELVLQQLKPLSEVAYVRFASVYRQFTGIRDFADTLSHLQGTELQATELQGTELQGNELQGNELQGNEDVGNAVPYSTNGSRNALTV